jgi:hypothetical protein
VASGPHRVSRRAGGPARPGGPDFLTASACGAGGRGAHADNGSGEHSPASPMRARRFDRVEASPSRINTVATSGPESPARPRAQGARAGTSPERPGPGCFPSRRSVRRRARGRVIPPAGHRSEGPRMPARRAHREPPDRLQPQARRRPEEAERPDGSGPTRRHARDPYCRSKSSGMLSAPGLRHRNGPPLEGIAAHAARKSWHRSRSVMRDDGHHAPRSGAAPPPPLARGHPRTVAGRRCSSNLSEATRWSIARRPCLPGPHRIGPASGPGDVALDRSFATISVLSWSGWRMRPPGHASRLRSERK